jgi:hypothetical protein
MKTSKIFWKNNIKGIYSKLSKKNKERKKI